MCTSHQSPAQCTAEACANCFSLRKCEACFEELVKRFQPAVLQFLIHKVGSRHDAEDLLQETFLIAYRKIGSYKSSWKFSTWLFTIASRLAISKGRRRKISVIQIAKQQDDPRAAAEDKENRSLLWDTVRELLEQDSFTAIWLSYVEQMSADEIGKVIGRNANSVRILLHRARARLADQLKLSTGVFSEVHHGK